MAKTNAIQHQYTPLSNLNDSVPIFRKQSLTFMVSGILVAFKANEVIVSLVRQHSCTIFISRMCPFEKVRQTFWFSLLMKGLPRNFHTKFFGNMTSNFHCCVKKVKPKGVFESFTYAKMSFSTSVECTETLIAWILSVTIQFLMDSLTLKRVFNGIM